MRNSQLPIVKLTREQLQQEATEGPNREQIYKAVTGIYWKTLQCAREGHTQFFCQHPMRNPVQIQIGGLTNFSNDIYIKHDDLIQELTKLFPGVTITSIEQKGTAQHIYQQAGILLDWS